MTALPHPIEAPAALQRRVVIGVEVEAYSISLADYTIGRRTSRPRPGMSELGERFMRDTSIGSEYVSRPFHTVREALFLLKSGLRKYLRDNYRGEVDDGEVPQAARVLLSRATRGSALAKGIGKQAFYHQIELELPAAYAFAREVMASASQTVDRHWSQALPWGFVKPI